PLPMTRSPVAILWSRSAGSPEPTRQVTARSSPGSRNESPVPERRTTDVDQHHVVTVQRHGLYHGRSDLRVGDGVLPRRTVLRATGIRGRRTGRAGLDGTRRGGSFRIVRWDAVRRFG